MQTTQALDDDRVMSLVELAMSRPRDEREAYVKSVCQGDAGLFAAVWNYVAAEQRMSGFLLDPLCPVPVYEHPFEPGELVDSRFRIVREVARGGMGVVYEATDEKLDKRVAIKCAIAGFNKRLPPEVRNAREISHPNVCRTFEMHTAVTERGEIDFLTMEFLDGQTLSERLRAGPLPEAEARDIARQLCAGLGEAHHNHVIHGDLKTGNVILTTCVGGEMRAVITDFGMARGLEASQRNGQSVEAGGTPDYMAPELWKGDRASVASDIYALGVILFELAAGRKPHSPEESWPRLSWDRRLAWKPPAVDPKWDRVLDRCLDPDPGRRFHSAEEIAKAFGPSRARRWFPAAAAAVILATASGIFTYERATAPLESVRLAVLRFESDPATAPLADRLLRDTSAQMTRLKGNAHTRFTFVRGKNATRILHGTLRSENGKVLLAAYLTDAPSGLDSREWRAEYAPAEMRYAPMALAGVVSGTLHLPPVPTAAPANADYLAGISSMRRDSRVDRALALLERAVASDPDSASTQAALGQAEWFKYVLTGDRAWRGGAEESLRRAMIRNPDLAAAHRLTGLFHADSGRYEQAEAEFLRAIEVDPANGDAYRWLGAAYEDNSQLGEALPAFRRAIEVDPGNYRNYQNLGAFYFGRSDYNAAAVYMRKAVDLAPEEPAPHFALASVWMNLGRFAEAENEFRSSIRLGEKPSTLHNLGVVLMYQGKDREAIPWILRALNAAPRKYLWW